jgi:hypothetical protein
LTAAAIGSLTAGNANGKSHTVAIEIKATWVYCREIDCKAVFSLLNIKIMVGKMSRAL